VSVQALAEHGLTLAADRIHYGAWSEEWGRQAAHVVVRSDPDCDAICGSDQIARGVADSLREMGRRVPDDIALVGFDNWGGDGRLLPTTTHHCGYEPDRIGADRGHRVAGPDRWPPLARRPGTAVPIGGTGINRDFDQLMS
jgi:hypothetical protein